jgi:hypothetical protein
MLKYTLLFCFLTWLGACASKPPIELSQVQSQVTLGQSSADTLAVLGLSDNYYRLPNNNRVLIYNQSVLYFIDDQLASISDLNSARAVITAQIEGSASRAAAEIQISKRVDANFKPELSSISASADYNPDFYNSLAQEKTQSRIISPEAPVLRQLVATIKSKDKIIWKATLTAASNLADEKQTDEALKASLSLAYGKSTSSFSDVVYANDARLDKNFKVVDKNLKNKIIFTNDKKNLVKSFRAFAFLGDEANFTESVRQGFAIDDYSTDTNAFCLAQRAGFVSSLDEILKQDVNTTISLRDHTAGRMYISGRDCVSYLKDKDKAAQMRAAISVYDHKPQAKTVATSSDGTSAGATSGDATVKKAESSGFDWQQVKDFLKPQVPGKK